MSIRRTKLERQVAEEARQRLVPETRYSLSSSTEKKIPSASSVTMSQSMYGYDLSLVKKDLLRTILVSFLIFGLLGLIYWYLQ
ncbi:MAG: hypothetical protein M3Q81_03935 [bacterium]|nr:hypothetical protein [bacterium]